ncbi:MAG: hypothetical protein IPQ09_23320 [Myxococcales bacterium]|nr:hypothetical protein [Myxococcales bacterium]
MPVTMTTATVRWVFAGAWLFAGGVSVSASAVAAPPPDCGTGLVCAGGPTAGASACRQRNAAAATVYCCPAGQRIDNGKCVASAPVCGRGLYCAGGPTPGASACRQQESSTREVFCCPEGQRIENGKCLDARTAEITSFYTDILHRAPAPEWLARHVNGGLPTAKVRESIAKTPEARGLVNKAYKAYLGREGEAGGLDSWTDHLVRGKTLDWVWEQIRTSEEARRKNGGQPPPVTLR